MAYSSADAAVASVSIMTVLRGDHLAREYRVTACQPAARVRRSGVSRLLADVGDVGSGDAQITDVRPSTLERKMEPADEASAGSSTSPACATLSIGQLPEAWMAGCGGRKLQAAYLL
jgi:hypothetical protein